MHILILLIGAISAAGIWYWRFQRARDVGTDLLDAANDVRLAARRLGFRRRTNVHPVKTVEDPRLAATGILVALAELDGALSQSEITAIRRETARVFGADLAEADELLTVGRWIVAQCNGAEMAVRRLSRRLAKLSGPEVLPDLEQMADTVLRADGRDPDSRDTDAVALMRRAFGPAR
ncbi:TerB family tellurite resistance protein [Roseobacter sp. HKCCA0434]|uniref:TerB family tellurite resistance protein n=1 Tax=Roseobacter sp. HKCCA0434 TaxID=3079297 RepID=UPI002905A44C|nr:TerB family tellurite resistance protein [Roseobacter sp. HKCCA0434]